MTSQLRVNVEIINEYYNLIMIFVTIIVLLLCLRTMKRVYRALRVRSSIIAERVVNIRGLGSYLMYFEGASRRHMNSIVHTRQVKPPTEMNSLQLLAKISRTTLSKRADSSVEVEIRLLNKVRCRVIVIANFRTAHFRRLAFDVRESPFRSKITDDIASTQLKIENALNTMHTEGQGTSHDVSEAANMILAIDVFPQNDWQIVTADLPQYSSRYSNNTSILPDVMMGAVSRTAVANENHTDIAIIVLPAIKSDDLQNKKTRSKSQFTQISNNQDFKPGADVPVAFDNTNFQGDHANVKRDDTISNTATNFNYEGDMTTNNQGLSPAYVYVYGLTNSNINNLNASSTELVAPIGTKKKRSKKSTNAEERVEKIVELSPLELFVFDNCGMPYVAQELFGLSTPATSVQLSETSSERKDQTEQSSQQAHTLLEGGLYIREDCVVCLTEAKSVVLLPCRHLCVCLACLTYIDKCPVCRAFFEEYVEIRAEHTNA